MIELHEACDRVRREVVCNEPERRALERALGCVLADEVVAPVDSPPYDKAMMDGYAVRAADCATPPVRLDVVEDVLAGHLPRHALGPGQASRIMTGASIPANADTVVMVEQTRSGDNGNHGGRWVEILAEHVVLGKNIMRQAEAMQTGQVVLPRGQRLRPIEIGLLAEAGRAEVDVIRPPRVAAIQTGDELVDVGQAMGPGKIRNSNGPLLRAMIRQAGGSVQDVGIVVDQSDALLAAVRQGLAADVLVLSGGVSEGDRDLVPDVLTQAGVECVFHKVQLRPGKPLWFGVHRDAGHTTLVFGLPGNPVSGLVCFRLFVTPTLFALAGREDGWTWNLQEAKLSDPFTTRGTRPTFWPGRRARAAGDVHPLPWLGSADPFTLARSDCLIFFADGNRTYSAGESISVIGFDA